MGKLLEQNSNKIQQTSKNIKKQGVSHKEVLENLQNLTFRLKSISALCMSVDSMTSIPDSFISKTKKAWQTWNIWGFLMPVHVKLGHRSTAVSVWIIWFKILQWTAYSKILQSLWNALVHVWTRYVLWNPLF